jgi:hypothetical protein
MLPQDRNLYNGTCWNKYWFANIIVSTGPPKIINKKRIQRVLLQRKH